jgi:hypothetical protein
VTDHEDQLREAFATQDDQVPDPAAVYHRVQELSQKYRRRRRGVQAAGGAVLGAGLIAGAIQLPGMLPGANTQNTVITAPAAAPSATPGSTAGQQTELDAFFDAGYTYDDALRLAGLWQMPASNISAVKAEAGRRLLAGQTLPFAPTPVPTTSAEDEKALEKFFGTGYTVDDAQRLATLWKLPTAYEAKVAGGKKLLAGETLPFRPSPAGVKEAQDNAAAAAFLKAGYVSDDAERLAKLWRLPDTGAAKVAAGKKLLAGQKLPFKPDPANVQAVKDQAAYEAYFNAGYGYDQAVQLAALWHLSSPGAAKAMAGKKLLAGETLPIKP